MVKRLPAMQETWIQSQGWKDLPEKEMATHSSTLAWKIPWREEPGRLQSMGLQRDITLLTKVRLVKAMVFLVVMYGCESWEYKES